MKVFLVYIVSIAVCFCSCASRGRESVNADPQARSAPAATVEPGRDPARGGGESGGRAADQNGSDARKACREIKIPGRSIDAAQTFAVDFVPFRASCFVTAHDPEFTDPPLDSEFHIYRDGRQAFVFPGQFNGTKGGCWVTAVAFEDLNADALTDVIVAGLCGAKSGPYAENMVYVNTGTEFTTDPDSNYKLNDLRKIKDISDFVKRNKEQFFKK